MKNNRLIIGAGGGGGGGGGGSPSEAKDNLESTAYAEIIDLLGEGEIEGFSTPCRAGLVRGSTEYYNALLKDVYLDNTPILRSGASNTSPVESDFNYKDVVVHPRFGTGSQSRIPLGAKIAEEIGVGATIEKDVPITRTITDASVDEVRVTITVPQLQRVQDDGDISGSTLAFKIQVQYNGGGFNDVVSDSVAGRTADEYQRDYIIRLREQDPSSFPVDVRVVRVTDDSDSARLSNSLVWTSYTELVEAKLNYPHSALVGLRIDAKQFRSVPARTYRLRGLKVKIPSNATVDNVSGRLIYSGVWNGTFGAAQWTSDPAWCLWDLLTSQRYGLGTHIAAAQLDKWAFYAASQYASTLVPDGFGGTEPRFSCNGTIQAPTDAYKLINELCSVMRAMPYWSTGALTISQDRPADPTYLFTLANITEDGFSYSGSDVKSRPNVAIVQYLDLRSRDAAYEQVEDRESIQRYGIIKTEVTAFACTSRGQAARIGEWLLYASQYETEVVSFTASIEAGVVVRPGQIIEIADPVRSGMRRGGRLVAATTSTLTVDDTAGLPANGSVSVILPNGTIETRDCSRSGAVITLTSALSATPNVGSVWVFRSGGGIQTSYWRVLTVEEQDATQYAITALSYNASKYDYIERDRPLQFRDVTNLLDPVLPPTNLTLSETLYEYQGQVRAKVIATWRHRLGVNRYTVRWRKNNSNWNSYTTQSPDHEILNITPGTFEIEVYSLDTINRPSSSALTGTITALGKTAPPSNVTGFQQVTDPDIGVQLQWNPITDLDLRDYEIRQGGSDWASSTLVTRVAATTYKVGILEPGTVTYRIKARDTSGVYSALDATRTVIITAAAAPVVERSIEDPVVALSWTTPRGSYSAAYYDLRHGASWASGVQIAQVKGNAYNLPVTWSGSRTFWVAAVDAVGTVGDAGSRVVTINSAPAPTVSAAFYGRSCTLTWNAVSGTLGTRFYEISQGATYDGRTVVTRISSDGTGYSLSADWSGPRTFWVAAVDGNGNLGTPGSVVATISPAPAPSLTTLLIGQNAQISWAPVRGTLETAFYEIRRGSTWETAPVVGRVNATFFEIRVNWSGTERFLVRAVDINGLYGATGI